MSLGAIRNLDYAILLCNKMDETRAFYRDIMKFPIETDLEKWVSFRVGAALLTLRPRGPSATMGSQYRDRRRSSLPFESRPRRSMPATRDWSPKGVPILRGPTDLPDWRHRTLFFRDPEYNIIEIYAEY